MKIPNILIIDDEKKFTDTFAQFLSERFKATIFVRENTKDGIDLLNRQQMDVLFQDICLPGPSGEHVIDHLKNIKRINDMIIFIISKWNEPVLTSKFENDNLKFIPKPISLITTQKVLIEEFESSGGFDYKK